MNRETAKPFTELEERLRFETPLADLSSKFVNLPAGEVDREIIDARQQRQRVHWRIPNVGAVVGSRA